MREMTIRIPRLGPIEVGPDDPRLFGFNVERDDIVREVVRRVTEGRSAAETEALVSDAIYHELSRLERQRNHEDLDEWRGRSRQLAHADADARSLSLNEIATHWAWDVTGNFDPRVFKFASRIVPALLMGLMSPSALPNLIAGDRWLRDRVVTQGHVELLRRLSRRATLVLTPTHQSNLDSIVLGFVLEREGLPPVTYGAGKNLFTNPLISFFMHNLGAYRVDRRVRAELYKDVLKTYSAVVIERGYHSLFFPGGTRSRSGSVESRIKLGLLGSAVEAQVRSIVRGEDRPVAFVPATINYVLTLEAESLIEDHLKESGKAQYIMEDDEFSRLERWTAFFRKMLLLDGAVTVRFGRPIDAFGHELDEEGRSHDVRGRVVDRRSFTLRDGEPVFDAVREAEYTRDLGDAIAARLARETVIVSTHIVARVLFQKLAEAFPDADLFHRLRLRGQVFVEREQVLKGIETLRDRLRTMAEEGKVAIGPIAASASPEQLLERALGAWNGYHSRPGARWQNGGLVLEDLEMLYYYQNRLSVFAKELGARS